MTTVSKPNSQPLKPGVASHQSLRVVHLVRGNPDRWLLIQGSKRFKVEKSIISAA
ncbi:hypothetical protein L916_05703, partial [Phytophthora nicotianae]